MPQALLPLAVAVALFYPLLVLDAIVFTIASRSGHALVGLLIVIALDIYVVRATWRVASKPTG